MQDRTPLAEADDIWLQIEKRLDRLIPGSQSQLPQGAPIALLDSLERRVGSRLPRLFRAVYERHNGMGIGGDWPSSKPLMSIERIDATLTNLQNASKMQGPWPSCWLPIAADEAGNHTCLELPNTRTTAEAPVVTVWHEDRSKPSRVANSFRSYLLEEMDFEDDWLAQHG